MLAHDILAKLQNKSETSYKGGAGWGPLGWGEGSYSEQREKTELLHSSLTTTIETRVPLVLSSVSAVSK